MKYELHSLNLEGDFYWCVYEISTDQFIYYSIFEDEARDYISFLLKGGAFAGWTPAFILESCYIDFSSEDC